MNPKILKYFVLPKETTDAELNHARRINSIALWVCAAHIPLFIFVAFLCGTSIMEAFCYGLLLVLGPFLSNKLLASPRHQSIVFGFTSMGLGALLAHLGQGPAQIEMHFHVFAAIALLTVWGNPLVIWVATVTVIVQHAAFWFFIPSSVFNYDASLWVIAVHAAFVIAESIAAATIARTFFDDVIGLESIVKEKTQAIRNIMDNVTIGLFICDSDLKVREGFSKSITGFFNRTVDGIQGASLPVLLQLSLRDASHLKSLYMQVFEDIAPEELSLSQLPNRFTVNGRDISLIGSAVRNASGQVDSVLFCATDITALVKAEAEVAEAHSLLKILRSRERFQAFIDDVANNVERMKEALDRGDQEAVRRSLHTIKGNLGLYGLNAISSMVHEVEDKEGIVLSDLMPFEETLKYFLLKNSRALGTQYGGKRLQYHSLSEELLTSIENHIQGATDLRQLKSEMGDIFERVKMKRADEFLGPIDELCAQLAKRFGKKVRFELLGGSTLIPSHLTPLMQNLTHLVRNSIDHGIEPARERGSKDKMGRITMSFHEEPKAFIVEVSDDGRGIDTEKLETKAVESGKVSSDEVARMSQREKLSMIFLSGVSTAKDLTDLSGRGIGMAAVVESVKEFRGTIDVESKLREGTRVIITIPKFKTEFNEQRAS